MPTMGGLRKNIHKQNNKCIVFVRSNALFVSIFCEYKRLGRANTVQCIVGEL